MQDLLMRNGIDPKAIIVMKNELKMILVNRLKRIEKAEYWTLIQELETQSQQKYLTEVGEGRKILVAKPGSIDHGW